ncbi:MAG: hypothetical protein EOP06_02610 [Proteobacteria bacterium]|nr:MAG: hypothetical protein EOP06_02610 [Pseudomonadota bacterium]
MSSEAIVFVNSTGRISQSFSSLATTPRLMAQVFDGIHTLDGEPVFALNGDSWSCILTCRQRKFFLLRAEIGRNRYIRYVLFDVRMKRPILITEHALINSFIRSPLSFGLSAIERKAAMSKADAQHLGKEMRDEIARHIFRRILDNGGTSTSWSESLNGNLKSQALKHIEGLYPISWKPGDGDMYSMCSYWARSLISDKEWASFKRLPLPKHEQPSGERGISFILDQRRLNKA